MQVSPISNTNNQVRVNNIDNKDKRVKAGVVATSLLGVATALAHVSKRQGFSLSPSVIKNTPIKDWAIFRLYDKNNPSKKLVELEGPQIIELAGASVLGGLLGGAIFDDKKHLKAKLRESVNQMLGNVLVPICCVWAASDLYKKNESKILKAVPQIKESGLASKIFNKALKALPGSFATIAALSLGILAGNRVSNFINEKIFNKKVKREIKSSDFAPHVDDLGMAISLMATKSKFSSFIQRIVPAFLCVPGIEVGMHRDE